MSAIGDSLFRLTPHRQSWRVWDGAVVVFEPSSGDTHRINHPAGSILTLMAKSENTRTGVKSALGSVATTEEIDEALDLLLDIELLEPA